MVIYDVVQTSYYMEIVVGWIRKKKYNYGYILNDIPIQDIRNLNKRMFVKFTILTLHEGDNSKLKF